MSDHDTLITNPAWVNATIPPPVAYADTPEEYHNRRIVFHDDTGAEYWSCSFGEAMAIVENHRRHHGHGPRLLSPVEQEIRDRRLAKESGQ